MKVVFIDTETTGTDPEVDQVVEIGALVVTFQKGETPTILPVETLIKPTITIGPQAMAIHHITNEMVADAPAYEDVIGLFKGADIYCAHNAKFDMQFLPDLCDKPWICTLKCAYEAFTEDCPGYSNQVLSYWLNVERPPAAAGALPHRALYDTYCSYGIFREIAKLGWSFKQMIEVSGRPRLLREFGFGKHKNEPIETVPQSYFDWIINKSDFDDEDVLHTARHHLGLLT